MINHLKKIAGYLLYYTGLYALLNACCRRKGVCILMYHRLAEGRGSSGASGVPEGNGFERQVRYLVKRFRLVSMDEAAAMLQQKRKLQEDCLVLTLDDGYRDNLEKGLDIFEKYTVHPTLYVASGEIDGQCGFHDGAAGGGERLLLNWEEIRRLAAAGVDIGGHTLSHPDLTALRRDEMLAELKLGKRLAERHLSVPVRHFAYPYGLYNREIRNEAEKLYDTAVTTRPGVNYPRDDLYELKRIGVTPDLDLTSLKIRLLKAKIFGRAGCWR